MTNRCAVSDRQSCGRIVRWFVCVCNSTEQERCATTRLPRWSATMAPACARPVSPETMLRVPCSRRLSAVLAIRCVATTHDRLLSLFFRGHSVSYLTFSLQLGTVARRILSQRSSCNNETHFNIVLASIILDFYRPSMLKLIIIIIIIIRTEDCTE